MKGFIDFIREQGVVGLAVGFILGGAVSKVVTALVNDIINPVLFGIFGFVGILREAYFSFGQAKILWGDALSTIIDFLIVGFVVYYGVHLFGLEKLDKKK